MAIPPAVGHQLGPEEAAAHKAVSSLFEAARGLLPQLAKPVDGSKASAHLLEKQIQAQLSKLRTAIRDLELLAEEQDTKAEKTILEALLQQHRNSYAKLRNDITVAQRTAMQSTFQVYEKQRQELLSGAAIPALLRKPGTESEMVSTATDITAGLRRAKMALTEQIQHTEGNTTLLDNNTDTLTDVNKELTGQKDLLKDGKKGLKTVERQASGDRWLTYLFFCVFLAAAGYVGFKRAPPVVKVPITSAISFATRGVVMTAESAFGGAAWVVRKAQHLTGKKSHDEDDDELSHEYMYKHDLDERMRIMDERLRKKQEEAKHRQQHRPPHHRQRPDHDQPPEVSLNNEHGTAQIPYKRPGVDGDNHHIVGVHDDDDDSALFGQGGYAAYGGGMGEGIKAYTGEERYRPDEHAAEEGVPDEFAHQNIDIPRSPHTAAGVISAEEKEELLRQHQEQQQQPTGSNGHHQHKTGPPEVDTYPDGYGHASASGVAEADHPEEAATLPPSSSSPPPTASEASAEHIPQLDIKSGRLDAAHGVRDGIVPGDSQGQVLGVDMMGDADHMAADHSAHPPRGDTSADVVLEPRVEEDMMGATDQPVMVNETLSKADSSESVLQPADDGVAPDRGGESDTAHIEGGEANAAFIEEVKADSTHTDEHHGQGSAAPGTQRTDTLPDSHQEGSDAAQSGQAGHSLSPPEVEEAAAVETSTPAAEQTENMDVSDAQQDVPVAADSASAPAALHESSIVDGTGSAKLKQDAVHQESPNVVTAGDGYASQTEAAPDATAKTGHVEDVQPGRVKDVQPSAPSSGPQEHDRHEMLAPTPQAVQEEATPEAVPVPSVHVTESAPQEPEMVAGQPQDSSVDSVNSVDSSVDVAPSAAHTTKAEPTASTSPQSHHSEGVQESLDSDAGDVTASQEQQLHEEHKVLDSLTSDASEQKPVAPQHQDDVVVPGTASDEVTMPTVDSIDTSAGPHTDTHVVVVESDEAAQTPATGQHAEPVDADAAAAVTAGSADISTLDIESEPVALVVGDGEGTPARQHHEESHTSQPTGSSHLESNASHSVEIQAAEVASGHADSANTQNDASSSADTADPSTSLTSDVTVDAAAASEGAPAVSGEGTYSSSTEKQEALLEGPAVADAATPGPAAQHAQHDVAHAAVDPQIVPVSPLDSATGTGDATDGDDVAQAAHTPVEGESGTTTETAAGMQAAEVEQQDGTAAMGHTAETESVLQGHVVSSDDDTDLYGFNSLRDTDVVDSAAHAAASPAVDVQNESVGTVDDGNVATAVDTPAQQPLVEQDVQVASITSEKAAAAEPITITVNATNGTDMQGVAATGLLDGDDLLVRSTDASAFQVYDESRVNASVADVINPAVNATSDSQSGEPQSQEQTVPAESVVDGNAGSIVDGDANVAGQAGGDPASVADMTLDSNTATESSDVASGPGNETVATAGNITASSGATSTGNDDDDGDEYDDDDGNDVADDSGDSHVYDGDAYDGGEGYGEAEGDVMEMPPEEEDDEYADPDDEDDEKPAAAKPAA